MLLPRLNSPNSPIKPISNVSSNSLAAEEPSTAQMVEPPVCDIFLCDYCGADFETLVAIKVSGQRHGIAWFSLVWPHSSLLGSWGPVHDHQSAGDLCNPQCCGTGDQRLGPGKGNYSCWNEEGMLKELRFFRQAKFLWYLNMSDRNQTSRPPNVTPLKVHPFAKKTLMLSDRR